MRTWFDKDKQEWVSEIPRAYWIGVYDYRNGRKIYPNEGYYWSVNDEGWIYESKLTNNAKIFYIKYGYYTQTFSNLSYNLILYK